MAVSPKKFSEVTLAGGLDGTEEIVFRKGSGNGRAALATVASLLSGGSFIAFGTGAVTRTPQNKLRDFVTVEDYGAVGDGVADDKAAIQAAIDANPGKTVRLLGKTYRITGTIALTSAVRLEGLCPGLTEIKVDSTTAAGITLANGVACYELVGFKLTRNGTPGTSAHGIQCLGTTDKSVLENLVVEDHYDNVRIGTCDTGFIRKLESRRAYRYGVYQTNAASYGPSQWDVDNVLLERNAVDGWRVESTAGPAGLVLGAMRNIRSFANGGRGLHLVGNATTPIYDLRLNDAFLGDDALGCVRIDSYGGKHRLSGFFERASRTATGRTLSTPATNAAVNIEITANNTDVTIFGSTIDEAGRDGIQHNGGQLIVSASMIYQNGQGGTVGLRNGINSTAGRLIVNGCRIGNLSGSAQLYGVGTTHDNVTIVGNDLTGNATQATTLGATTNAVVFGNAGDTQALLPVPIDLLKFNQAVTPTATGGPQGAGTLNMAAGLFKNGTAYTNP